MGINGDQETNLNTFLPLSMGTSENKELDQTLMVTSHGSIRTGWILLVEEGEVIHGLLSDVLSRMGYKVRAGGSEENAPELFYKGSYNVVLSDPTICSTDVWTLVHYIQDKLPNTSVCVITGWGEAEIGAPMNGAAVDYTLFQPFSLGVLQKRAQRMLIPEGPITGKLGE